MPLDMPSLADCVGLRNRIIELEMEVLRLKKVSMAKDTTIDRLRKKCGVKRRTSKRDIMNMIMDGASRAEIQEKIGCHKSSIVRARKELKEAGYELRNK